VRALKPKRRREHNTGKEREKRRKGMHLSNKLN